MYLSPVKGLFWLSLLTVGIYPQLTAHALFNRHESFAKSDMVIVKKFISNIQCDNTSHKFSKKY